MATFTKHMLISDIILRITKGKPSDDLELEHSQIAFWIDQILPNIIKNTLTSNLLNGGTIDPSYIYTEECIVPLILNKDCIDCQNNVYVTLEFPPIDLYRDRGVLRVATESGQWADKVTLEELDNLKRLRFSKPTATNIKYHRVKDTLYFHGITSNSIHLFKFNISYVPLQNISSLNDSDIIYVGEDVLKPLSDELEVIARRQIYQSDIDEQNNAKQDLNIQ